MAKKKHKNRQTPRHPQPAPAFRIPMANPGRINVQKIKDEATRKAVEILQEKMKISDEERERIRKEAYDRAIDDALRYILICGSKALNNKYRFAYVRLERYIDETMRLIQDGDIEEMSRWFEKVGFKLSMDKKDEEEQKDGNS